jgi:hypothetical protein
MCYNNAGGVVSKVVPNDLMKLRTFHVEFDITIVSDIL